MNNYLIGLEMIWNMSKDYDIRPGDIILWGSSQKAKFPKNIIYALQRRFDGEVRHSEMVYSYCPEQRVAKCFGANFDGVKFRAHCIDKPYVAVIRPLYDISSIVQDEIGNEERLLKIKKRTGYDTKGMINSALNAFLSNITLGKWKKRLLFSSESRYYCSETCAYLCSRCYSKLLGSGRFFCVQRKDNHIIPNSVVSPADLYKASNGKYKTSFKIIKDFEK